MVGEPSVDDTVAILRGLKEKFELHHGVRIKDSAIIAAAVLSHRYIADRFLPDKAIDLIDEAGSALRLQIGSMPIEIDDLDRRISHLEIERQALSKESDHASHERLRVVENELERLRGEAAVLKERWNKEKSAITRVRELKEELDNLRQEEEKAMIGVDMSEYMEKHAVARMVGSRPGYVGYDEGGQLTEQIRRRPYSVVLFDEIEKAHPDVFHMLLQILDDGRLTDGQGRTVSFKNTVIVMTSNIGTGMVEKNTIGFSVHAKDSRTEDTRKRLLEALRQQFRPEF